jgi:hypothetical protein
MIEKITKEIKNVAFFFILMRASAQKKKINVALIK